MSGRKKLKDVNAKLVVRTELHEIRGGWQDILAKKNVLYLHDLHFKTSFIQVPGNILHTTHHNSVDFSP
jgi:hypothetical protein